MVNRIFLIRLAFIAVLVGLVGCAPSELPTPTPTIEVGDAPVRAAGNFAGAIVNEDYDEAFSYMTTAAQEQIGTPDTLAAQFSALCLTELDRYQVQMQPTEQENFVVNVGTLVCEDGNEATVFIIVENVGPYLWLVRDYRIGIGGD